MEPKAKIQTITNSWRPKARYSVNQTVTHGGSYWQNITGINDEPSESSNNWFFAGSVSGSSGGGSSIEIGGNIFEYRPMPSNVSGSPVNGDIAANGWIGQTEFGLILVLNDDANPELLVSWDVISKI